MSARNDDLRPSQERQADVLGVRRTADDRAILVGLDEAKKAFCADVAQSYGNHLAGYDDENDDSLRDAYVTVSGLTIVKLVRERVAREPSTWPKIRGVDRERCLVVPVDVGKRSAMALVAGHCYEVVVDPFTFHLNEAGVGLLLSKADACAQYVGAGSVCGGR